MADGTVSKVTIVPFYDRSGLIYETLGTLEEAIILLILISIILVLNSRAAIMVSSLLPIVVLMTFIVMKYAGVDADIVALSSTATAIGVMLHVGVIFTEDIIRHLEMPENEGRPRLSVIYEGTVETPSAVLTALATTIISFIPVFAMTGQEGKLFGPLVFTKTFAIVAAKFLGLGVIPALAHGLFSIKKIPAGFGTLRNCPGNYAAILRAMDWDHVRVLNSHEDVIFFHNPESVFPV